MVVSNAPAIACCILHSATSQRRADLFDMDRPVQLCYSTNLERTDEVLRRYQSSEGDDDEVDDDEESEDEYDEEGEEGEDAEEDEKPVAGKHRL